jgi:hypothetical protein
MKEVPGIGLQHISNNKIALFPTKKDREVNLVECSDDRRFSDRAWPPFRKSSEKHRKIISETAKEGLREALQNLKIYKISYHNSHPNRSATQKFVNNVSNSSILSE